MVQKEFNWEEFLSNNRIGVNCQTEEQAKDFCRRMHEHELEWRSGVSYLDKTDWHLHKESTCYFSDGSRSDLDYSRVVGYRILEWSDYTFNE